MARLVSQAKLGYYPTPPEVVDHLRQALVFEPGARLLDPCCGNGEVLAEIAKGHPVETYGIELEQDRFTKAEKALSHVLWGDALKEASVSAGFDMLYLNPPYDFDEGGGTRLEHRFLAKYRRAVAPQGLIVMVFPLAALRSESLRNEIARLSSLSAFAFPEGDLFERFHQLVIVGWKKTATDTQLRHHLSLLERIAGADPGELPGKLKTTAELPLLEVRKVHSVNPLEFRSQRLDPDRVLAFVESSVLWKEFFSQIEPPSMTDLTPLVPMRQGHLAMLVAAGFCNGAEIKDPEDGSRTLLVKGTVQATSSVQSKEETDTFDIIHIIHTHKIRIRMLSVSDATIEEIE